MKKYSIATIIIAAFITLQACSKKDTGPIATGYEGLWTGRVVFPSDTITLNLKLGGAVDGLFGETIYGNWVVVDTLMTITTLKSSGDIGVFIAKANKDTLDGMCRPSAGRLGLEFFRITRKK